MTLTAKQRKELIETRLQAKLSPFKLEVIDESHLHIGHEGAKGGASHFAVVIVAQAFESLNAVQRHQLIYQELRYLIPHEIHALKISAKTCAEN
ncbi:MAG: BolA family transcriptional regulator [Proteobacteria bacterium]|nr:BolA family transcriptional regulator [Pseudomonadota bacterium]